MVVNSGTRTTLGGAISSLMGLKKFEDLVVHAVDRGGEVLVADRRFGCRLNPELTRVLIKLLESHPSL